MRLLSPIILSALLSACIGYLPMTGEKLSGIDDHPKDKLDFLLGKTESEIRAYFANEKPKETHDNDYKYLVYHQLKEFGLFFLIIAGPYGGGGGASEYVGTKTTCYKFTLNKDDQLENYEIKSIDRKELKSQELDDELDCRLAFWTNNELIKIRKAYRNSAKSGETEAMMFLAKEYDETEYLSQLAIDTNNLELAVLLAKEFNDRKALSQLASDNQDLETAVLLAKEFNDRTALTKLASENPNFLEKPKQNIQHWNEVSKEKTKLTIDELEKLAQAGDAEAQLQLYWNSFGPKPIIWLCRAADQGHPEAQYHLGDLYWFGETQLIKDRIKSYKWYQLASNSLPRARSSAKTATRALSADELLLAERLLIQWKPGQCEAEIDKYIKVK